MKIDLTKIGIVGHVGLGKTALSHAMAEIIKEGAKTVFLHSPEINYDLEINGTKYKRIEKQKTYPRYAELSEILHSDFYEPYINELSYLASNTEKLPMPKVDIVSEFTLIQNKASKLSKRERDWVVSQFNKQFYIV